MRYDTPTLRLHNRHGGHCPKKATLMWHANKFDNFWQKCCWENRRRMAIDLFCRLTSLDFSALTILVGRQEEHPASKNWLMRCWCGYLSAARCRCLHMVQLMPLHPQTPSSLASFKSRQVLPFWYRLTQVVLEKRSLNRCSSSSNRLTSISALPEETRETQIENSWRTVLKFIKNSRILPSCKNSLKFVKFCFYESLWTRFWTMTLQVSSLHFYRRDAMLARVLTMALCLCLSVCVCHKSVFCWSGWTDRAGFWHGGFFRPVLHCALRKFR